MKKKRCYIYTRVSTMVQTEGYSLDAQQEKLKKYAEYKNLEIAGEYCDAGKSDKSIKGRPAFQQMMEDVASQKDDVSYVLVFKLSRFGRNAADVLKSLQLLQDYEVDLVSVDDSQLYRNYCHQIGSGKRCRWYCWWACLLTGIVRLKCS